MKNKHHRGSRGRSGEGKLATDNPSQYRGHGKRFMLFTVAEQAEKRDVGWIQQHGTKSQKKSLLEKSVKGCNE